MASEFRIEDPRFQTITTSSLGLGYGSVQAVNGTPSRPEYSEQLAENVTYTRPTQPGKPDRFIVNYVLTLVHQVDGHEDHSHLNLSVPIVGVEKNVAYKDIEAMAVESLPSLLRGAADHFEEMQKLADSDTSDSAS